MNERIKELANISVRGYVKDTGYCSELSINSIPDEFLKKFSDLLLQECMTICGAIQGAAEYKNMQDFAAGAAKCKEIIKRDFGVE